MSDKHVVSNKKHVRYSPHAFLLFDWILFIHLYPNFAGKRRTPSINRCEPLRNDS